MKTFTIDENNNITVFGSKEAAGATGVAFSGQKEFGKLSREWPIGRFIEIWNGFAGVAPFGELKPVKKFMDRKTAITRIWQAVQRLNVAIPEITTEPVAEVLAEEAMEAPPEEPSFPEGATAAEEATVATQVPDVTPEVATPTTDASPIENAAAASAVTVSTEQTATKQPKRQKAPKPAQDATAPRESKTAQVVAMLQRPEGATITEIMTKMGWPKHTVRGFMAGTMKKAGYNVESFKPDGGERSYRIPSK